jgi:hypothetical protein
MSNYLTKYKGKFRVIAHYDLETLDYPRDSQGEIDDTFSDIYITCSKGNQIYHYGGSVLVGYIPSLKRGRRIINELLSEHPDVITDIIENDLEIEFKFNAKHIDIIAEKLKAKTIGCNISPFSVKNLPKIDYIDYTFKSEEEIINLKETIKTFTEDNQLALVAVYTKLYNLFDDTYDIKIKKLAKESRLKPLEYIDKHYGLDNFIKLLDLVIN